MILFNSFFTVFKKNMDDIDERYHRGKIYCLRSNNSDLFYLGSTIHTLEKRLRHHESHYRAYQKGTDNYCTSYDVLATGDYEIVLYNEFPCHNRMQLEIEEGYAVEYYMQYAGCVNECIPGMSARFGGKKQWDAEKWKNTEIIHCSCGGKYHDCTKSRKRHFESKIHKYWIENGQVKPKGNDLIRCECGGQYTFDHRTDHFKTLKHQKYIASQ